MSNVVLFPTRRSVPASAISRHEFEKLADLALDIVERVISLLDEVDGDADINRNGDIQGAPQGALRMASSPHHTSVTKKLLRPKALAGLSSQPSSHLIDERPIP
ncbi:hypothetical protein [Methylobacterium sp. E-045]|uniref:hypothetical protein n=1 Tax=Methylobacterium sp. E-045 TaxID=2836575 RepID=UPI001FBB16B6|nr:hypothetical protein [Methylobacterium sp. E-045]MCJ2131556.1 hypothetical protein [Methylobacterium sp. E-045]